MPLAGAQRAQGALAPPDHWLAVQPWVGPHLRTSLSHSVPPTLHPWPGKPLRIPALVEWESGRGLGTHSAVRLGSLWARSKGWHGVRRGPADTCLQPSPRPGDPSPAVASSTAIRTIRPLPAPPLGASRPSPPNSTEPRGGAPRVSPLRCEPCSGATPAAPPLGIFPEPLPAPHPCFGTRLLAAKAPLCSKTELASQERFFKPEN